MRLISSILKLRNGTRNASVTKLRLNYFGKYLTYVSHATPGVFLLTGCDLF